MQMIPHSANNTDHRGRVEAEFFGTDAIAYSGSGTDSDSEPSEAESEHDHSVPALRDGRYTYGHCQPQNPQNEKDEPDRPQKLIRVMVVDDHQAMREGLIGILSEEQDITVIAEATDGEEAIEILKHTRPDVILMDVSMPRMNGKVATRAILDRWPDIRIVGLSMHGEEEMAKSMLDAGAAAYLTKGSPLGELIRTVRYVT